MEQSSGSNKKGTKGGVPLWLFLVLFAAAILMAVAIAFFLLLHFGVISCAPEKAVEPEGKIVSETTALPDPTETQQTAKTGEEPAEPGEGPTEPGEEPTGADEEPTGADEEPTGADEEPTEKDEEPTETGEQPETPAPIIVDTSTEAPTETPTPKPTQKPDSFQFGGKKIKAGEKKINGKKLGINGKNKKPRHISPEEVQDLVALCPDLEELELEYCSLENYELLGQLVKLKKLVLTYCGTGDGNPVKNIDWVSHLTELRTLNFSHNKVDDTEALAGLKKLTYLHLSGNPLEDEDLKPIGNLTNLEKLYLYDLKKITDVSPLSKLSKLKFLHLGHNSKLKSIKSLTGLKKLENLRLNHTKVNDLSYFKGFSALKKLDVAKCPIPADSFYKLKDCKKLKKIVLDMGDEEAFYVIVDMINDGYDFHVLYNWSE